jgi:hypothetical protein
MADLFLGEDDHTLIRRDAPTLSAGIYAPGAEASSTIRGSLQALSGRAMERLPEGQRARATHAIYTYPTVPLRIASIADGTPPDLIESGGRRYEVIVTEDWTQHRDGIKHHRAVLALIEDDEDK